METKTNEVDRLYALFDEYRNAYAAEWERLDRCERIYRGEHWSDVPVTDVNEPRPVTPETPTQRPSRRSERCAPCSSAPTGSPTCAPSSPKRRADSPAPTVAP